MYIYIYNVTFILYMPQMKKILKRILLPVGYQTNHLKFFINMYFILALPSSQNILKDF